MLSATAALPTTADEPLTPTLPITPEAPTTPAEPTTPAAPTTPAEPTIPAAPVTPAEPTTPDASATATERQTRESDIEASFPVIAAPYTVQVWTSSVGVWLLSASKVKVRPPRPRAATRTRRRTPLGDRHLTFAVDDIEAAVAGVRARGGERNGLADVTWRDE